MRLVLALVASLSLLAGCGDGGDENAADPSVPASSSSAPSPDKPRSFATVTDLRDAAVEAGYGCYDWKQDNVVRLAAESGTCGDDDVFATFASDGDLQRQLETYRDLGEMGGDVPLLVGPNWIILSEIAPSLESELGGTVSR